MSTYEGPQDEPDFNEHANAAAKRKGLRVVLPEPHQLFIDIDNEKDYLHFKKFAPIVFGDDDFKIEVHHSVSGLPHRHITINFNFRSFSAWQRVALQAVLGSDRNREMLSARTLFQGLNNYPTCFFEERTLVELTPDDCII